MNKMSGHPLKQTQTVLDDGRPQEENNPFESFFGPLPPGLVPVRSDSMYPYSSHALPFAYQGRNYFLASVLDFLITSEDNFLTANDGVCPFVKTDEIHVQWNTFTFNRTMADYEPEYGVPRLVTMESDVHSDSLARRGLAFELEHGFFKTPIGRATYLQNLRQISEACLETTQYGVIYAILTCKNEWRSFAYMHNTASVRPQDVLKSRKQEWAIVNRSEKGLYRLDALIKDKMRERGISPDTWLLAPRTAAMFQMNEFHTEYYRSGARYRKNLEEGADAIQPFRNSRVYEVRKFDADFADAPKCPLSRLRSIGSYWVLPAKAKYITIYDMDSDSWKTLSREELKKGASENETLLLMRPFETYQMGSGVLLQRGSEFGNTFVGNNDFMLADNATSKTHIGHYTFYHKTVIRRPELCYLAEDIYCEDYVNGEGVKVYATVRDVKDDIANNLNGSSDRKGDIVVIAINPEVPVTNPIDIKGSFQSEIHGANHTCFQAINEVDSEVDDDDDDADKIYKALKDNVQRPQNVDEDTAFNTPFERHNTICFRGAYCLPEYDDASKRFGGLLNPNTGFWGPDCYAGCREARTGNMTCLKKTEACNGSFFNCPPPKGGYPKQTQSGGGGGAEEQEEARRKPKARLAPVAPGGGVGEGVGGGVGDNNDNAGAQVQNDAQLGYQTADELTNAMESVQGPEKQRFINANVLNIVTELNNGDKVMRDGFQKNLQQIEKQNPTDMEMIRQARNILSQIRANLVTSVASSSVVNLMDAEPSAARRTSRGSGKAKLKK